MRPAAGFSDHFLVYARFSTQAFRAGGPLSEGLDALREELPLGYESGLLEPLQSGFFLNDLSDAELGAEVGKVFQVDALMGRRKPLHVWVDGVEWAVYVPEQKLFHRLMRMRDGEPLDLVVRLVMYRGQRQLVIEALR